jgi:multidrug efflux pump subunit AcrA (membrane-fusion protein)
MRNLITQSERSFNVEQFTMENLRNFLGFGAVVRLTIGGQIVEWQARFARMSETLDPETRTVGVYVAVDHPYQKVRPGQRPPLLKNMYCEVELRGKPRPESIIIPRSALHQNIVYVATSENRLERKEVIVDYTSGNLVSLRDIRHNLRKL